MIKDEVTKSLLETRIPAWDLVVCCCCYCYEWTVEIMLLSIQLWRDNDRV